MTTLANRPNTALLIIDVQNGVVDGAHRRDAVVAAISTLVGRARREGVPVVWVQHHSDELPEDTERWRIVPELAPGADEPLVQKAYGDSFEATSLEDVLAASTSGGSWSPARRPTRASARPCTERSSGGTTLSSSAMRTPPRT